jgi:hypothetical protein
MSQETFERELARHADGVHGAPLSFDDVRGRARSIQRRRRAAVTGGVAAAVALAVIVPSMLGGGGRPGSQEPEPAGPASGHTAVLHDHTLTLPDGGEVALDVDNEDVSQLGVLTDGRIVVATGDPLEVTVFDADGSLLKAYPVQTNAITMSPTDDAVAWVGADFRVRVLASGAAGPVTMAGVPMPGESPGSIDAVLSPDHLLVGDWNTTIGEVTPDGYREITTSEPLRVTDVSPDGDLWAVQYPDRSDPQFGCAGLYDPGAATMLATNCETALLRFAPDGQHLTGAKGDGGTWASVEVFDRDLDLVGTLRPDGRGAVKDWAWADSDHVYLALGEGAGNPSWRLVRSTLDGTTAETVAGPTSGPIPELASGFILSE